ncbi:MAG: hypothetical protein MR442_07955 [Lachnospiraceae bacterium]|nr:hypothetical protein [Lachnospiraceae bacterium]
MIITFGDKILVTKEKIDKVLCSLYLFVLVFAPPIIPYPYLFLTIISFLALITTHRLTVWNVIRKSGIYEWVSVMALLAIYTIIVPLPISVRCNDIVNISHYISIINRYGVMIVVVSVCVTYLLCKAEQNRYGYEFLIESFIDAGVLEGTCSILAFLFPNVKNFFIFFMKRFSESMLYSNTWYITVRSYGFASTLVDVFGFGVGVIAGICFFYGITGKKKYIIESVVIAVATLLNSRTGLLIYIIAVVVSILCVLQKRHFRKMLTTVIAIGILAFLSSNIIRIMSTNEYTLGWFQSGINSVFDFINGTGNSTGDAMSTLFQDDFWKLPDFPRIIFGTGHSIYRAEGYVHSDVGYINELWLFGIIGCLLLYGKIVEMCMSLKRKSQIELFKYAAIFLLVSYFFFNIKGVALGYNPGAVSVFIIIFVGKYQSEQCME